MKREHLIIPMLMSCLSELMSCQSTNATVKPVIDDDSYPTSIPSNHRMNPEVPRTASGQDSDRSAHNKVTSTTTATKTHLESLPFNVDFVDQPDQFEVGQSFFMPTRRAPLLSYRPVIANNLQSREDTQRWSLALDEPNERNDSIRDPINYQKPIGGANETGFITFDDDDSETSRSTTMANTSQAARSRQQVESDLSRSLAEQSRLIKLLGRRIDSASEDATLTAAELNRDNQNLAAGHQSGFVALRQTNGFMRGQVPANHIVRHPNHKFKTHHNHQSVGPVLLSRPEALGKSGLVPLTTSGIFQPITDITAKKSDPLMSYQLKQSRPTMVSISGDQLQRMSPGWQQFSSLLQSSSAPTDSMDLSPHYLYNLQSGSEPPVVTSAGPNGSKVQLRASHRQKPAKSGVDSSDDNESGSLSDDEEPQQMATWKTLAGGELDEVSLGDAPQPYDGGESVQAHPGLDPYQHQIFKSPMLEYTGSRKLLLDRSRVGHSPYQQLAPNHYNVRPTSTLTGQSSAAFDAFKSYHHAPSHRYSTVGSYPVASVKPPQPRFHHYHDSPMHDLEPRLPSASHKVLHIHTKEKGHGKYLWPILGGGLTMLMGFLIVSNMLLSIPLLAMGASTLFNHGGFHTQQLVPVYNLSQLARPAGRRRKRWSTAADGDGATQLASLREDFQFRAMLHRVVDRFTLANNKCRSSAATLTSLLASAPNAK